VSVEVEKELGVGQYVTRDGQQAEVFATVDGMLYGRVNHQLSNGSPFWLGMAWKPNGKARSHSGDDIGVKVEPRVKATYWLNIYQGGPGMLRKTWEESLIEASRNDTENVLCRVEIKVDAKVGEGLR
jgi:hypothetical protein